MFRIFDIFGYVFRRFGELFHVFGAIFSSKPVSFFVRLIFIPFAFISLFIGFLGLFDLQHESQ